MSEIDPHDGLPLDLEAAVRAAADERRKVEEERAEFAQLYAGEWMSTSAALAALAERGSTRAAAEATLLLWLQTNDGQRPHLRARADRAIRTFPTRTVYNNSTKRDAIIHSWEWVEEIATADWGTGTFKIKSRDEGDGEASYELQLFSVSVSQDDIIRRLRPSSITTSLQPRMIAPEEVATPSDKINRRGRPPGRRFQQGDVIALQRMKTLIMEGNPLASAAKQAERELFSNTKTSHWDRLRKAYPFWLNSLDDKSD